MGCPPGLANPCPATLAGPASQLFLALVNALFTSQCGLGPEGRYPPDHGTILRDGDEFDFIVVGSGSAGSVVANRLSQNEDWKILLLEAGTYPSALTEIPSLFFSLQGTSEDWQYVMEPSDTSCLSTRGNACPCARGKVMGGGSSINAMMYIRGNRRDFDRWAELGNAGWDYESVVRNFKKFENVQIDNDDGHYGKEGELKISRYISQQPIRKILKDAYRDLGYDEYNELSPLGTLDIFMTTSNGTRSNAAKAFIESVKERKNLFVTVNAHVGKLLLDQKVVTGVEVKINDRLLKIKAKKEVVLSSGSIGSPQILLNSGIGPQKHLDDLGIHGAHDLKVGENLQDHNAYPVAITIDEKVTNVLSPQDIVDEFYKFLVHRDGTFTTIGITNFVTFINTRNDSSYPDVQILHTHHPKNDPYLLPEITRALGFSEGVQKTLMDANKKDVVIIFVPYLLNPKSRGKLLLRDQDPFSHPRIVPNYFTDEDSNDIQVMVEAIKLLKNLLESPRLQRFNAKLIHYDFPQCDHQFQRYSDDYWKCSIRHTATHVYHQVGTCKMGPKTDPDAVVDPRLRVHGMKGVRVMDASIMPVITSANTNSPTIMIGEKGAEMIKEDWEKLRNEL